MSAIDALAYTVGFTVHECRDLELQTDGPVGGTVDPLVIVRCLGEEYVTAVKEDKQDHATFEEEHMW